MSRGYIYALKNSDNGLVKIGRSVKPLKRVPSIITSACLLNCDVDIFGPFENHEEVEKKLHSIFSDKHVSWEWFNVSFFDVCSEIECITGEKLNKDECSLVSRSGSSFQSFIDYMKRNIDENNFLLGTQRELATKSGVSLGTVTKTLNSLSEKKLIKKVRSGCYMVSPNVMANGSKKVGAMVFRLWGDI